ncbi:MAG: AhpC/TSA family protein [Flavisolibacter sp.]|nr:AhpC/TSA family protein [Flavisolibacter sp.]
MECLFSAVPRKFIFTFCYLFLNCFSFAQDTASHWFSVKAFLPNWNGCAVELKVDGNTLHTGTVTNDMYSFVDTVTGVHQGLLQIKRNSLVVAVPLFIEKGTIKIVDKGYNQLIASGTPTNDAYQNLLRQIHTSALLRHGYDYEKAADFKRQLCINFIKQHPKSLLSLQLLKYYLSPDKSDGALHSALYGSLDSSLKNSYLGRQMSTSIEAEKPTAIGQTIPDLLLPDTLGRLTPLYGTGELTLLDFWASWCGPCRQQNRELVKVFNTYSTKGFTVVSVSLDTNRESWLNAIKRDKLAWSHLSDLKGWESIAAKTFHVTAVPMNLLLDAKGCIIAKNLHPSTLNNLLAQRLP